MNPNSTQVSQIDAFVGGMSGGWNNTDAQIRAHMATTGVANPVAQATIQKPFAAADLLNACSSGNRANLGPYLIGAAALIIAQDTVHLGAGIDGLEIVGTISSADQSAMRAILEATELDPSWTSTVAWDVGTLGRPADDFDLETARHS